MRVQQCGKERHTLRKQSSTHLHRFGGLTALADSPQVEAFVSRVAKLQLEGRSLTQDADPHSVQAVDVDWQHLTVHASLTGAETDAHLLACSRSKHTRRAVYSKAVGVLIPEQYITEGQSQVLSVICLDSMCRYLQCKTSSPTHFHSWCQTNHVLWTRCCFCMHMTSCKNSGHGDRAVLHRRTAGALYIKAEI